MRVFGPPADDRQLHRMTALAMERNGGFAEAHAVWQLFDKELGSLSRHLAGRAGPARPRLDLGPLGKLAADGQADEEERMLLPFVPRQRGQAGISSPRPRNAIARALSWPPNRWPTHRALFEYLLEQPGKQRQAFKAGKKLLERFSRSCGDARGLGSLCQGRTRLEEACEYLQRALQRQPHGSTLRLQLARCTKCAPVELFRRQTLRRRPRRLSGCHAVVRSTRQILPALPGRNHRAESEEQPGPRGIAGTGGEGSRPYRLPVVFALMCESIRQKLTPAQKKPFAQEFQTALAGHRGSRRHPGADRHAQHPTHGRPPYTGQKTHEKKILALSKRRRSTALCRRNPRRSLRCTSGPGCGQGASSAASPRPAGVSRTIRGSCYAGGVAAGRRPAPRSLPRRGHAAQVRKLTSKSCRAATASRLCSSAAGSRGSSPCLLRFAQHHEPDDGRDVRPSLISLMSLCLCGAILTTETQRHREVGHLQRLQES